MSLLKLWFKGYVKPLKMVDDISRLKMPFTGLSAVIIRGLLNSILLFLPLYLFGRQPSLPGYLSFVKPEKYFLFLALITPLFFLMQWLCLSGFIYLGLRFSKQKASFDYLLNLYGLVSLIVGAFLVVWDWLWVILQSTDYLLLGCSHLIIDIWWIALTSFALKRVLGVGLKTGIVLNISAVLLTLPPAMLIMRSPI